MRDLRERAYCAEVEKLKKKGLELESEMMGCFFFYDRVRTFAVGLWMVHWCLSMRYIHKWFRDPQRIWWPTGRLRSAH